MEQTGYSKQKKKPPPQVNLLTIEGMAEVDNDNGCMDDEIAPEEETHGAPAQPALMGTTV